MGLSDRHRALTQMSRARSQTPAAVFLANVGGAARAQLGSRGERTGEGGKGGGKGRMTVFPASAQGVKLFR